MKWTEKLFRNNKPIIAMVHMNALPTDPLYKGESLDSIVEWVKKDILALQNGGVDGLIFSNEFSLPYQRNMQFITPACMAYIIGRVKNYIQIPYGVDCISDGFATLDLARAVDAQFVRGTFSGVYVGDGGFYNNELSEFIRRKNQLSLLELPMIYFLHPESDVNLDTRSVIDIAKSLVFKANSDTYCISSKQAGAQVSVDYLKSLKEQLPDQIILCNTGANKSNIKDILEVTDGAIVGTTFKKNGEFMEHVDKDRVIDFMKEVQKYR